MPIKFPEIITLEWLQTTEYIKNPVHRETLIYKFGIMGDCQKLRRMCRLQPGEKGKVRNVTGRKGKEQDDEITGNIAKKYLMAMYIDDTRPGK